MSEARAVVTGLSVEEVRSRLEAANRRGRLAEVEWEGDGGFVLQLPSRPLPVRLRGRIEEAGAARRIVFATELERGRFGMLLAVLVLNAVFGPWLTDYFLPSIHAWWWYPPLAVAHLAWVGLRWPGASMRDAETFAERTVGVIEDRLGREASA